MSFTRTIAAPSLLARRIMLSNWRGSVMVPVVTGKVCLTG